MSKFLVDVSEHQGLIDWNTLKNNIDGAIIRSSWGWGDDQADKRFHENMQACDRLGIPQGVYHFSYARNVEEAKAEANLVLKTIKGYVLELPVYYDIEYSAFQGDLEPSVYRDMLKAFADIIEGAGYACGVYANQYYFEHKLYDDSVDNYTKWIANYGANDGVDHGCSYSKGSVLMHQYTSVGHVSGINGNVDCNNAKDELLTMFEKFGHANYEPVAPQPDRPVPKTKYQKGQHVVFSTCYVNSTDDSDKAIQAKNMRVDHGIITDIYPDRRNMYLLNGGLCFVNDGDIRGFYQEQQTYTVQSGDSLSSIGYKLGVNWQDIANKNGIASPYTIYPGQVLKV